MTDGQFSAGDILSGTAGLLRRSALRIALALALMTLVALPIDSGMIAIRYEAGANFLIALVMLVLQYWLTRAALQDLSGRAHATPRFLAFFGLGVVTTVGIVVGFMFLIVPGIVLLVRWSIAIPILLDSDEGVFAALGRSWRETEPHFWPILLAYLPIYAPTILIAISGVWLEIEVSGDLIGTLVLNLALNGAAIAGWYAAVAIYAAIYAGVGDAAALTDVFE